MADSQVFRMVSAEWTSLCRSPAARRRWQLWRVGEPLDRFGSLDEVVAFCQHGDRRECNRVFAALAQMAVEDPFAARVSLQASLPGLWNLACRMARGGHVGPGRAWPSRLDLDHEVLAVAAARLRDGTASGREWPAAHLIGTVRDDLRQVARVAQRFARESEPLDPNLAAPVVEPSSTDRAATLLVHAAAAGIARREDLAVLYTTRVLGHRTQDLAAELHYSEAALRKRRQRAIARLRRAALDGLLADAS